MSIANRQPSYLIRIHLKNIVADFHLCPRYETRGFRMTGLSGRFRTILCSMRRDVCGVDGVFGGYF
jgi:hypothetical protein